MFEWLVYFCISKMKNELQKKVNEKNVIGNENTYILAGRKIASFVCMNRMDRKI
jgi:hypothetical protein